MAQASIRCQAAVARAPNQPLTIERIDVSPPKAGEVRIRVTYASVSQLDLMALKGVDLLYPKVRFPLILGLEGAGIVESIGEGVSSVAAGDAVIPICLPQCKKCRFCESPKTNWCQSIYEDRNFGDAIFSSYGKSLFNFGGVSSFAEYTVCAEAAVVKIGRQVPLDRLCLDKLCLLSCDFVTGYGAALNCANVEPNSSCGVWGLGTLGLAAIAGCRKKGARQIIGIDSSIEKFALANNFGATDCSNSVEIVNKLTSNEGVDFAIECTGSSDSLKQAVDSTNKHWGSITVANQTAYSDFGVGSSLAFGRKLSGCLFGGFKMRGAISALAGEYLQGNLRCIDDLPTRQSTLVNINEAFELLRSGQAIKTVMNMLY